MQAFSSVEDVLQRFRALGYVTGDSLNTWMSDSGNRRIFGGVIMTPSNLQVTTAAGANPWGEGATTLEWTLPSPPPFHSFEKLPRVK